MILSKDNAFRGIVLAMAAVVLAFFLAMTPMSAIAAYAEFSNPSVNTVAQVRTDGSMYVDEQRTYDFDVPYNMLVWQLTGLGEKQDVDISSVRITQMDEMGNITKDWMTLEEVPFQTTWRELFDETGGETEKVDRALIASREKAALSSGPSSAVSIPTGFAYAFDSRRNAIYMFLESTSQLTVVACDYLIENAVLVYDDTAELYWDYIAPREDAETDNVRAQVQLPMPDSDSFVPGSTVMAWGHGPDGTVDVRPDGTVEYRVPKALPGQYAQAHLLFPRSWLTNLPVLSKLQKSGTRFDDAVAEERSWTDSYSAGLVNGYVIDVVFFGVCACAIVLAALAYVLRGRERRPDAEAVEQCDLGAYDAAVLGRLGRWNRVSNEDVAATLVQLARKGVIRIDAEPVGALSYSVMHDGGLPAFSSQPEDPEASSDVRFRMTKDAKREHLARTERMALAFVFDDVGGGYQSVSLAEIENYCRRHPSEAAQAIDSWQSALSAEVDKSQLFDAGSRKVSRCMFIVAAVFLVLAVADWLMASQLIRALALFAVALIVTVIAHYTPRRTQVGCNVAEAMRIAPEDEPAPWQMRLSEILDASWRKRDRRKS